MLTALGAVGVEVSVCNSRRQCEGEGHRPASVFSGAAAPCILEFLKCRAGQRIKMQSCAGFTSARSSGAGSGAGGSRCRTARPGVGSEAMNALPSRGRLSPSVRRTASYSLFFVMSCVTSIDERCGAGTKLHSPLNVQV